MKNVFHFFGLSFLLVALTTNIAHACACGCGVFDVGTSSMLPSRAGGMAYLSYDYSNQNQNWHGTSSAPSGNNDDKDIRTNYATIGLQYLFNRSWGVQAEAPYWYRHFETTNDVGDVVSIDYHGLGDIRIKGVYTGFSEDLSAGIDFGVKLPTGSYSQDTALGVDRDTQIGSGSTDILLGGFYRHALVQGNSWSWIAQAQFDQPVLSQGGYTPGTEFDESFGVHYNNLSAEKIRIKPVAQIIASERTRDTGPNAANPVASGYQRVLLSPGIEFQFYPVKLYADVELPVYQNMTGEQLVAPLLIKVSLSSMF